jgi:hypothetical protein
MVLAASACAQHDPSQDHPDPAGHAMHSGAATQQNASKNAAFKAGPHGGSLQQLENTQIETVVTPGGMRVYGFDLQGKPLDLRNTRGLILLKAEGDTKKYRYDLFPEIATGGSADSLAVAADLSRISGRHVALTTQLVGLPGAGPRPVQLTVQLQVPRSEAEQIAAAIQAQGVCPVSGQPLGEMGEPIPVTVGNETVYVCCAGCIDAVKSNPSEYFPQPVVTRATEADAAAIAQQKICPVMDKPLEAMGGPYKTVVAGRVVYLCCPGCAKKLHATPALFLQKLADPGGTPPGVR